MHSESNGTRRSLDGVRIVQKRNREVRRGSAEE